MLAAVGVGRPRIATARTQIVHAMLTRPQFEERANVTPDDMVIQYDDGIEVHMI